MRVTTPTQVRNWANRRPEKGRLIKFRNNQVIKKRARENNLCESCFSEMSQRRVYVFVTIFTFFFLLFIYFCHSQHQTVVNSRSFSQSQWSAWMSDCSGGPNRRPANVKVHLHHQSLNFVSVLTSQRKVCYRILRKQLGSPLPVFLES